MAEVQMIQLKGQTMNGVSKKVTDNSQSDFLGMLKDIRQSVSESEQTYSEKNTRQEGIQEDNRKTDSVAEDKELDKTEQTDNKVDTEVGEEVLISGTAGEEMFLLTELAVSLSESAQNIVQQPNTEQSQTVISEEITEISAAEDLLQADMGETVNGMAAEHVVEQSGQPIVSEEAQNGSRIQEEPQIQEAASEVQSASLEKQVLKDEKGEDTSRITDVSSAAVKTESSSPSEASVVPIKGEEAGTLTVRTSAQTMVSDISETIASRIPFREGTSTLELTLEPADLGRITIRMVYEDGGATISLISGSSKTLEILSQNVSEIAQILQEKTGLDTVVYVPEGQQAEQDNNSWTEREGRQQQQQREQPEKESSDSFVQQLRLGLI